MTKKWTGDLVGLMHDHQICQNELADHLDVSSQYVSMVLNGHRSPKGAEERFRKALEELITERGA